MLSKVCELEHKCSMHLAGVHFCGEVYISVVRIQPISDKALGPCPTTSRPCLVNLLVVYLSLILLIFRCRRLLHKHDTLMTVRGKCHNTYLYSSVSVSMFVVMNIMIGYRIVLLTIYYKLSQELTCNNLPTCGG